MSQLVQALTPRAHVIADILSHRLPHPGAWEGYTAAEQLIGTLEKVNEVKFTRPGHPDAKMYFGFLRVKDIDANQTGEDEVVKSEVIERQETLFKLDKPIRYTETLSHTFTHAKSVEEATEQAWKVGAKVHFEAKYGGIGGGVEASAEYGQKLARKTNEQETVSDTITKELMVQGPVEFRWVAERATDWMRRKYNAVPDLDFKLYFQTGAEAWEWASYRDVFVEAARGNAPVDTDYSIFAGSSESHDMFEQYPVSEEQLSDLDKPLAEPISFEAEFQVVTRQKIEAL